MKTGVQTTERRAWLLTPTVALSLTKENLLGFLLMVLVMMSAVGVVYGKEMSRQLFTEVQMLQHSKDVLQEEWGQLLLEQAAWSRQARIQGVASTERNMVFPRVSQTVQVHA